MDSGGGMMSRKSRKLSPSQVAQSHAHKQSIEITDTMKKIHDYIGIPYQRQVEIATKNPDRYMALKQLMEEQAKEE